MEKIPTKKFDSNFIIEYYCEKCGESITFYPEIDEKKIGCKNYF